MMGFTLPFKAYRQTRLVQLFYTQSGVYKHLYRTRDSCVDAENSHGEYSSRKRRVVQLDLFVLR